MSRPRRTPPQPRRSCATRSASAIPGCRSPTASISRGGISARPGPPVPPTPLSTRTPNSLVMSLAVLLLLLLLAVPVVVSACLPDPRGGVPWHQAPRDPTDIAPDPATTHEAVVQVYAAQAVSWRGVFSVHSWIVVKPTGAPRYTRYEVVGFGV